MRLYPTTLFVCGYYAHLDKQAIWVYNGYRRLEEFHSRDVTNPTCKEYGKVMTKEMDILIGSVLTEQAVRNEIAQRRRQEQKRGLIIALILTTFIGLPLVGLLVHQASLTEKQLHTIEHIFN